MSRYQIVIYDQVKWPIWSDAVSSGIVTYTRHHKLARCRCNIDQHECPQHCTRSLTCSLLRQHIQNITMHCMACCAFPLQTLA
jgi:hypothetical protein